MNWPEDSMGGARRQVPTESWYSSAPKHQPVVHDQFEPSDSEDEGEPRFTKNTNANQMESTNSNNAYAELNCEESDKYLWGYQALYQQFAADPTRDSIRHIARPKLMLVSSEYTNADRERLRPQLDSLISGGFIRKFNHKKTQDPRDVQDVITDFMIEVFKHTKLQLTENGGYTPKCPVSFVLTVPVIWSQRSSRVLQYAVEAAIGATGFGTLDHGGVDNLFIINEPEAAAAFLLGKSNDMLAGETLVVLDCGGGTVDCVTYTITNSYPLRLKTERSTLLTTAYQGDNCGASYLNDNFEKYLLKRLAHETYLEQDGESLEEVVKRLVPSFEDRDKRRQDVIIGRPYNTIYIKGLRSNREKRFKNQHIELNRYDYNEIFMPLLRRVGQVLRGQIEMASYKGKDVKKVCLIGGFGACPSLRSYLRSFLKDTVIELKLPQDIVLETTSDQKSLTAVSSGAVLRAPNKDGGPERKAFCSYGFLQVQIYEPDFEGHIAAESWIDPFDQKQYVEVIFYFMLKGEKIDSVQRYDPITIAHAFAIDREKLRCEEVLYVSDLPTKNNFPTDNPHNKGAYEAGRIVIDFTFLRDEGKIHPIRAKQDEDGNTIGQDYYEVTYDLVVIVEGRNLKYEAIYPPGGKGTVRMVKQISIAAAFLPGTE
ncbi:hypothetical protein BDZ45DRAFT_628746 [Acephala macrosclerotiorum]|nr:hypothetical protein BDZ45DRAFT_628746 [Acephala macrosclerotiorum]